ncbi:MAG: hypothetical protein M0002_16170 [Rhodospirillales bacterium]|nr:hypothetical protein [Rhodospirillales bacterium]
MNDTEDPVLAFCRERSLAAAKALADAIEDAKASRAVRNRAACAVLTVAGYLPGYLSGGPVIGQDTARDE